MLSPMSAPEITATIEREVLADAVDGGRRDEHDRVARHHEADQHRGLEHDAEPREEGARDRIHGLHRVEDPVEELVHGSSVSTAPDWARHTRGRFRGSRPSPTTGTATSATDAASAAARTDRTSPLARAAAPRRRVDARRSSRAASIAASGFAPDADSGYAPDSPASPTRSSARRSASVPTARRAPSSASISVSVTTDRSARFAIGNHGMRAVPGAEREPHEVVELVEVGALVGDHRGELVGGRAPR